MRKIDVHCHVFNKDVLTLGGKVVTGLGDVITDLIDNGDYNNAETTVERINAFLEVSESPAGDIAALLYEAYGDDSIIVPLMYDMYYLTHDRNKDLGDRLQEFLERFDAHDHQDTDRAFSLREKMQAIKAGILRDIANDAIERDSFETQVQDMRELKNRFSDRIYPFMSFDPRRSGNLDAIKENVGPGRPFHGVKLYAPLGFSAADGAMMDKQNGLYAYCAANDIPLTAHCSCPGMPTMNSRLHVPRDCWVFASDTSRTDDHDGACSKFNQGGPIRTAVDETVDFSDGGSARKSLYFNHPDIWKVVLQEFPDLRLNLAHFGGDCSDWRDKIARMIDSNTYRNLYTDISCRTNTLELQGIRATYDNSEPVRGRLMFGSDFSILLLSSDLTDFLGGMGDVFPFDSHGDIYWENARRFLNLS